MQMPDLQPFGLRSDNLIPDLNVPSSVTVIEHNKRHCCNLAARARQNVKSLSRNYDRRDSFTTGVDRNFSLVSQRRASQIIKKNLPGNLFTADCVKINIS